MKSCTNFFSFFDTKSNAECLQVWMPAFAGMTMRGRVVRVESSGGKVDSGFRRSDGGGEVDGGESFGVQTQAPPP